MPPLIANSRMGKGEIVGLYGVPPEKIRVVYNGIDTADFQLSERERYRLELAREYGLDDELRILYVGSGFDRKGVPAIIEAVAKLSIPFRLFVVGKGRTGGLLRRARRLGVEDRVVFAGPIKDVERFYLGCDLFVFPTRYDPFSNATLEAMACGLPVITSRFNGVAELIEEGGNGLVVADPLDSDEIARCIGGLGDADLRREMGRRAELTAEGLSMVRNTRESLEVIEAVLKAKRSAASGGAA